MTVVNPELRLVYLIFNAKNWLKYIMKIYIFFSAIDGSFNIWINRKKNNI